MKKANTTAKSSKPSKRNADRFNCSCEVMDYLGEQWGHIMDPDGREDGTYDNIAALIDWLLSPLGGRPKFNN